MSLLAERLIPKDPHRGRGKRERERERESIPWKSWGGHEGRREERQGGGGWWWSESEGG